MLDTKAKSFAAVGGGGTPVGAGWHVSGGGLRLDLSSRHSMTKVSMHKTYDKSCRGASGPIRDISVSMPGNVGKVWSENSSFIRDPCRISGFMLDLYSMLTIAQCHGHIISIFGCWSMERGCAPPPMTQPILRGTCVCVQTQHTPPMFCSRL